VRAKVEYSPGVIKRVFGFVNVRDCGLKKNAHCLLVTYALANLFMSRRHLLRREGHSVSGPCHQTSCTSGQNPKRNSHPILSLAEVISVASSLFRRSYT
jgi:hypothetical protein